MEINANPSFNMFLERDLPNGEVEKTLSELDKYLKTRVASEAIKIVTNVYSFFNPYRVNLLVKRVNLRPKSQTFSPRLSPMTVMRSSSTFGTKSSPSSTS